MKASVLFGAGWENDSLEVLWRDAGRAFCRLWREDADVTRYAFIPASADAERPDLESVNRLTHEHELKGYLDSSWALRPLELCKTRRERHGAAEEQRRTHARSSTNQRQVLCGLNGQ